MDPTGKPERAGMLAAALNASMRGRERAPVVLTCRIGEYQALTRGIDRATHIEMLPLTSDEAVGYLLDQFLNDNEHQRWEPVLANLHVSPRGPLATQLATPWRLTLALTAFREEGNPSSLLPSAHDLAGTSAQMYAQRVDSLLLGRYVSSAVRLHDPGRRYTEQDVQRWLTALADGLARQARQNKSATDIQLDRWWEPMGRWATRAVHIAVAALPGLAWLGYGLALHSFYFCTAGGFLFLLAFAAGPAQSPSRLKVRQMAARRGLTRLAVGVGVGVGGGLTLGFALKSNGGFGYGIGSGLTLGIASGLALAMLDDSSPQAIAPRDVIKEDGRYGLMMGGAAGLALGGPLALALVPGFRDGLPYGLVIALAGGLAFGLAFGLATLANVWTRYHVTVMIIAVRQQGPLRFGTFLDWAQQAGLMRVSGVAYQFRHRQLQDWLTASVIPTSPDSAERRL